MSRTLRELGDAQTEYFNALMGKGDSDTRPALEKLDFAEFNLRLARKLGIAV